MFLTVLVVLVAFAANSVLNRLAVDSASADPASFAVVRVAAGALMLCVLLRLQGGTLRLGLHRRRWIGAGALAVYMAGFSLGYLTLDAGIGALLLFGVVQVSMLAITAARGAAATARQILGASIAMVGLAVVLWPTGAWQVAPSGAAFMLAAGIGWGIYTLAGQSEPDALAGTAANFVWALPLTALLLLLRPQPLVMDGAGAALAILSGAVTSGLGYALWYRVLPAIPAATAATAMVAVPLIAVLGGVVFLGETVGLRFATGTAVVLGGILLSIRRV